MRAMVLEAPRGHSRCSAWVLVILGAAWFPQFDTAYPPSGGYVEACFQRKSSE
jgi:hypothetical protein